MITIERRERISEKAEKIFYETLQLNAKKVDRVFVVMLVIQWIACIAISVLVSPFAWEGAEYSIHFHVWTAIVFGGLLTIFPITLVSRHPGAKQTRCVIASAQVLYSALFIHLTSGRIESHFHVFVSLALLVAYRDYTVFIPAVAITAIDHMTRGSWWPQAVFGTLSYETVRPLEHAVWLLVEAFGLSYIVHENRRQWKMNAELQCNLKFERDLLENRVLERTLLLHEAEDFKDRILNSIDANVCILNSSGVIEFANEKWQTFSATAHDASGCGVGANYIEACERDSQAIEGRSSEIAMAIQRIISGETEVYSTEYAGQQASDERYYQLRLSPVPLNGNRGVAVVLVDITELKLAEQKVRDFARLVLSSPDEVVVADLESLQLIEVNKAAIANLGFTREELLMMELPNVVYHQRLGDLNGQLRSSNDEMLRLEGMAIRKNASKYPCKVTMHRGSLNNRPVWFAYISDLTEQKRLEGQLRQSQKTGIAWEHGRWASA